VPESGQERSNPKGRFADHPGVITQGLGLKVLNVVYDMQVGIAKQIENGPQITDRGFLRVSQTPLIAFLDASNHFFDA
jgi:hypothetical protein